MKNISFLISVLLLATLLHEAQGMKSRKLLKHTRSSTSTSTTPSLKNNKKIEGNASETKDNGKMSNSATTTTQGEDSGKQENFSVKSSPVVEQRQAAPKHYPDVVDLAEMDYSPARRKSPIHN